MHSVLAASSCNLLLLALVFPPICMVLETDHSPGQTVGINHLADALARWKISLNILPTGGSSPEQSEAALNIVNFRAISHKATSLQVLNCEGKGFDPLWAVFQQVLAHDPSIRTFREFQGIAHLTSGPRPDVILSSIAGYLIDMCAPDAQQFMLDMEGFYWELEGGGAASFDTSKYQRQQWWANSTIPDDSMRPFCIYGCIASFFVIGVVAVFAGEVAEAVHHLNFARTLGRHSVNDYGPSSVWGPVVRFASLLLDHLLWDNGKSGGAAWDPSALVLARRRQICDPILHRDCWLQESPTMSKNRNRGVPQIATVFLGEHATFCHDIALTVEHAATAVGIQLEAIYVGQFYLCQGIPTGCDEDSSKVWFRSWIERWEHGQVSSPILEADSLHRALEAHPHRRAASPDLFLCVDHAVFCWLLRRRASHKAVLSSTPALHVLAMVFLEYVPFSWRTEMMLDFQQWWEGADPNQDIFMTIMEHVNLQVQWQMGIYMPFVPSLGSALRTHAAYDPPDVANGRDQSVVVLRSSFWALPGGDIFSSLLRRIALSNSVTHPVRFDWMASYMGGSLSSRTDQGVWHSFEWMAQHTCALFIPPEISQLKFRDVYSMGLPMTVPDDDWMLRLLRYMYSKWGQLNVEWGDRLALSQQRIVRGEDQNRSAQVIAAEAAAWPHSPFYDAAKDPPERLEYWFPLADHMRYPHVVRFSSLPELLDIVFSTPWAQISVRMRAHFQHVIANVGRFYQNSLSKLWVHHLSA